MTPSYRTLVPASPIPDQMLNASEPLEAQRIKLFSDFFKELNEEDIQQILGQSCHKPSSLLMEYAVKIVTGPNVEIAHPGSNISLPMIYTVLSTSSQKACNRALALYRGTEIFYDTFYNNNLHHPITISLLHSAILQSKIKVAHYLLRNFPIEKINTAFCPVNAQGIIGRQETALSLAARKSQPRLMKELIQLGAKIYTKNPDGEDCLTKATRLGIGLTSHTLKFLFNEKEVKNTPVHHSLLHPLVKNASMKPLEMIASLKVLLENGNYLEALNEAHHTPLYESTLRPELKDVSEFLLDSGADPLSLYEKNGALLPPRISLIQKHVLKIEGELFQTSSLPSVLNSLVKEYLLINVTNNAVIS